MRLLFASVATLAAVAFAAPVFAQDATPAAPTTSAPTPTPTITTKHKPRGGYGAWVAPAGDLDGDGLADIVIGAEIFSERLYSAGRVYVAYGRQMAAVTQKHSQRKPALNVYLSEKRRQEK